VADGSYARKAPADWSSGILKVMCPYCGHPAEFPDWAEMYIFNCESCGESVEVVDP